MARPMILACGLTEERQGKLRMLCMRTGLLLKMVPEADYAQPIGALCGLAERTQTAEAAEAPGAVEEELLVFCHMDRDAVSRFLALTKQQRVPPFALKAMLTPTNAAWTIPQLFAELRRERAAVLGGGEAH